jgi:GAF domain-containing protein
MEGRREPEELATALARMARDLLGQNSPQQTVDRIVVHAVELVDGCESAGISVVVNRRVRLLAASDDRARTSDRIQGELHEGPCVDAARSGAESYRIADMASSVGRWPGYAPYARELGIRSMLAFKLFTEDENLGALTLYSSRPGAFTRRSEQIGWLLASHAAVAFASSRSAANLRRAISSHQDVGMAVGVLMERHKLSAEEAFSVLHKASQEHNTKLHEIARLITETGGPRLGYLRSARP